MTKEYIQTELAVEVAKQALIDICKEYGYDCKIIIGAEDLYTVTVDELQSSEDDFRWPEVVACNLTYGQALKYVEELDKDKEHTHILKQNERIENE